MEAVKDLSNIPSISDEIARLLVQTGFNTYSALAEYPPDELEKLLIGVDSLAPHVETITRAVRNEKDRRSLLDENL